MNEGSGERADAEIARLICWVETSNAPTWRVWFENEPFNKLVVP